MIRRRDLFAGAAFAVAGCGSSAAAFALRQGLHKAPAARARALDSLPRRLGRWNLSPVETDMVAPVEFDGAFAEALALYDRVVAVTYVAPDAPQVMLNLAYMRELHQERRFHWPEFCYATQGYDVSRLPARSAGSGEELAVSRFVARSMERTELVAYTVKVGDRNVLSSSQMRRALFLDGLALEVPDGFLFRGSLVPADQSEAGWHEGWRALMEFFRNLLRWANDVS
ncbi:exosortase C-terminal domain/associated protein EpsI [Novosphingobium resinovorum]|uniref:exosortase C-terminal domain/associated protein EpsI n=1 Tax=Novosphingobium resinovorum TaxID=158500 RepID=UPI002ED4D64D|nr:exosortase C-terminal domain/associated protein EpsI [Novosphingobium resinovorum]